MEHAPASVVLRQICTWNLGHPMTTKVLIVDDHPFQLQVMANLFAGHPGVEVEVCLSAEDAASRCLSQAYDLVVSDLQMPGMDGIQFIQALSAMPNGPLLALVSVDQGRMLTSAKLAAQSFGLKVLGVLHKPVHASEVDDLLRRLSSVLVTPRYSPPDLRTEPEEQELRQALLEGRITAWFQPKVCLQSGRIIGAEALARWVTEHNGVLSPAQFLPAIIRLALEKELLRKVLAASIEAQEHWKVAGHRIAVSINFPTHLLEQSDLPDQLLDFVEKRGGSPAQLCFELLEDSMTSLAGDYYAGACRLRMKGFTLAQDDFGQGTSSVHGLVNTPFNEIKIDRALVNGCSSDPALGTTLANIISLIRQLGMTSVAEGVETSDDLEMLRQLKCDVVQGYLISQPVPMRDFTRLLGSPAN